METKEAARRLAALGHPDRLSVFRLLMRFAPHGVRPTEMAAALNLKPNTLSHHLSDLTAAGLVQADRHGRSLLYSVDLPATMALIGYLALDTGRARPELLPHPPPTESEPMADKVWNALFICSGNSARSIFGEVLLNELGKGRFRAFSAGTRPQSALNPFAIEVLQRNGHAVAGLRSKHISEFQHPDAPRMDFVFTVCDTAAAEECPPWPGRPITGHWPLPDPAKAEGSDDEKLKVFTQTIHWLRRRIVIFLDTPLTTLDRIALQGEVDRIGALPKHD